MLKRFHVALWRSWPALFPEWVATVEALDAFSAIVQVAHFYGLESVASAAATAEDNSIRYRCFGLDGLARGLIWFTGRPFEPSQRKVHDGFFSR